MLSKAKVIAFVGTTAPEKARHFYAEVLGLRLLADEPSALVFDSNGIILRVSKVSGFQPVPFTALGWEVADIASAVAALAARGVSVERFEGLGQDDRGIALFPDGTQVAWFKDPDGNMLSLTEIKSD